LAAFPLDTGHDLKDKIDWEGGVIGALEWGLNTEDLPQQYRPEWQEITRLYQQLDERCTTFYDALPSNDVE
jgi:hypothetical protein